jgi:hypothetical protein
LAIIQNPGVQIYPSVPSNQQAGDWKAGTMVLLFHCIDESRLDFCDFGDSIQGIMK